MLSSIAVKSRMFWSKHVVRNTIDRGLFYSKGNNLNIGDDMNPWLVTKVTGIEHIYSNPLYNRGPHLFAAGSILQYADAESIVWGSGFISSRLTRNTLMKLWKPFVKRQRL